MNVNELIAVLAAYGLFVLGLAVFQIIVMWKLFTKAGQPGWAAIIPIYNLIVFIQIAKKPTWWVIWFFAPVLLGLLAGVLPPFLFLILNLVAVVGLIVFAILLQVGIAKAFGQGAGFAVGLIFFNIIFMAILAFGNYQYEDQNSDEAILA